jgi:hypothetical protein
MPRHKKNIVPETESQVQSHEDALGQSQHYPFLFFSVAVSGLLNNMTQYKACGIEWIQCQIGCLADHPF